MPIFEYICRGCQHHFETLVLGSITPHCPSCHGTELQKKWSAFGVGATNWSPSSGAGPCGSCGDPRGPGSCSMN